MFKIRLLILLLINLLLVSCISSKKENIINFSVAYIGGEYDGLILSNQLKQYLNNFGMLNDSSKLQIQASVSHKDNLFITNIDNTSDRMRLDSRLIIDVINLKFNCVTQKFDEGKSQFYILFFPMILILL